jgi:very-short-patch-repair endonuclease
VRLSDEVRDVVRREGVLVRRDHPTLTGAIARLVRDGELVAVLPGVYVPAGAERDRRLRLACLARWAPDAVLVGRTAAQLTFWPGLSGDTIECALPWDRDPQAGFRFTKRRVAPELVVERGVLRMTRPDLTALDLCDELGGDGIDQALRTRATTLEGLREALRLSRSRAGNAERRRLLLDSRDEPWSAAERLFHRLLREAGVTGWKANRPVLVRGQCYFLDVAFFDLRLVIEIDGRLHQTDPALFESDRKRQNALVLDGWTVLRFTWRMLVDEPAEVLAVLAEALRSIRPPR